MRRPTCSTQVSNPLYVAGTPRVPTKATCIPRARLAVQELGTFACQRALSVPRSNRAIVEVPVKETAPGAEVQVPARVVHELHAPLKPSRMSAEPAPVAKISSRPGPQEAASGAEVKLPPSDSQPLQPPL